MEFYYNLTLYSLSYSIAFMEREILLTRREGHPHHDGGYPGCVALALVEVFQELIVEDAKGVGHAIGCGVESEIGINFGEPESRQSPLWLGVINYFSWSINYGPSWSDLYITIIPLAITPKFLEIRLAESVSVAVSLATTIIFQLIVVSAQVATVLHTPVHPAPLVNQPRGCIRIKYQVSAIRYQDWTLSIRPAPNLTLICSD